MNFWETVDSELKYQNKERKDLADAAGFDVSNIGKGIKNGGVPLFLSLQMLPNGLKKMT